jgi:hypothetical protein
MTAADRSAIPDWLPVTMLVVVTAAIGPSLGAAARPLFLAGSLAVGWYAWSRSPAAHLVAVLVLFSFAPLLRRMVDYSAGFDPSGLMVAGPLLALVVVAPELPALILPRRSSDAIPLSWLIFAGCIGYGVLLTLLGGDWNQAATSALKWGTPVIYGVVLRGRPQDYRAMLHAATSAFVVILPITALYGLYQYVDPPLWDRYWLRFAMISSAGYPEPFQVRTFSTMHAPAAFATYSAVGLLTVCYLRSGWLIRAAMVPTCFALLLSLYRTAWLALALSLVILVFYPSTRAKSVGIALGIMVVILVALFALNLGDTITNRLGTLVDPGQDHSGHERADEFVFLWNQPVARNLMGEGFGSGDVEVPGSVAIDGMIATCWSSMGIVVGLVCLAAVTSVLLAAVRPKFQDPSTVLLSAIACGWIVHLPLANLASGELGFLFWSFMALVPRTPARNWGLP